MSAFQKASDTVEKGIASLGIAPETTRGAKPGYWDFNRGSVSVAVGVVASERFPNGYFYVSSVLMNIADVPASKRESFYLTLLELNVSLVNMKMCVSKELVLLISNRNAEGLDPEEVAEAINELSAKADLLDDRLKNNFK